MSMTGDGDIIGCCGLEGDSRCCVCKGDVGSTCCVGSAGVPISCVSFDEHLSRCTESTSPGKVRTASAG